MTEPLQASTANSIFPNPLVLAFSVELLIFLSRRDESQDIKEHFSRVNTTA